MVLESFARHGRSSPQSFPRKRESTPQTFGNALSTDWIPAFAGMTGVSLRGQDRPRIGRGDRDVARAREAHT
jgi:hypothetical protein